MGIYPNIKTTSDCAVEWSRLRCFVGALSSALVIGFTPPSHAQTGVSANAPAIAFYTGLGESCCGEDPHPVHGIATPDGGYVLVGKSVAPGDGWGGFAVKLGPPNPIGSGVIIDPDESPSFRWVVRTPQARGRSVFLNATATDDAVFIAGSTSDSGGDADMYLAKHSLANGRLIWEKRFADSGGDRDGAIEAIQITGDGGLIAGAITNAPRGGLEGFKSFGNPGGGQAHLFYLTARQVGSNTAPDAPSWSRTFANSETVKGVRPMPAPESGFVALVHGEDSPPTIVRLDGTGQNIWSRRYPGRFEPTDIAINTVDGRPTGFTFTGHGGNDGTLDGQLTHVDLEGNQVWTKSFGNPVGGVGQFAELGAGNPRLIYDECWGIQGTADGGVIVACGTGIEGCELWDRGSAIREECDRDPRKTWRGYVVRFDTAGETVWQRVDSFEENGVPEVADSASEYVFLTRDGRVASVVDQGFGIGLLVTEPDVGLAQDAQETMEPVEPQDPVGDEIQVDSPDEDRSPVGGEPDASRTDRDMPTADENVSESPRREALDPDPNRVGQSAGDDERNGVQQEDSRAPQETNDDGQTMDLSAGCDQSNSRNNRAEFTIALVGLLALRKRRK